MWQLKQEFVLLADVFKTYLPPEYPYDVVGGQRNINLQTLMIRLISYLLQIQTYFHNHKELV